MTVWPVRRSGEWFMYKYCISCIGLENNPATNAAQSAKSPLCDQSFVNLYALCFVTLYALCLKRLLCPAFKPEQSALP